MNEATETRTVLRASGIQKKYGDGSAEINVLRGVDLDLEAGERIAVIGRSGSGKSTLLHILAGLDDASAGSVLVVDHDMLSADADARARIRGAHMGFVYQNHHLLPEFTAIGNVAMPLRIAGCERADALAQAEQVLGDVGLSDRLQHLPSELSGGERQRVAVARALAGRPDVVLADEPTGNLDRDNAEQVMSLIARLTQEYGTSFLVVTHDRGMLAEFDRVLHLQDGRLQNDA